jgi:hypothetical protein
MLVRKETPKNQVPRFRSPLDDIKKCRGPHGLRDPIYLPDNGSRNLLLPNTADFCQELGVREIFFYQNYTAAFCQEFGVS